MILFSQRSLALSLLFAGLSLCLTGCSEQIRTDSESAALEDLPGIRLPTLQVFRDDLQQLQGASRPISDELWEQMLQKEINQLVIYCNPEDMEPYYDTIMYGAGTARESWGFERSDDAPKFLPYSMGPGAATVRAMLPRELDSGDDRPPGVDIKGRIRMDRAVYSNLTLRVVRLFKLLGWIGANNIRCHIKQVWFTPNGPASATHHVVQALIYHFYAQSEAELTPDQYFWTLQNLERWRARAPGPATPRENIALTHQLSMREDPRPFLTEHLEKYGNIPDFAHFGMEMMTRTEMMRLIFLFAYLDYAPEPEHAYFRYPGIDLRTSIHELSQQQKVARKEGHTPLELILRSQQGDQTVEAQVEDWEEAVPFEMLDRENEHGESYLEALHALIFAYTVYHHRSEDSFNNKGWADDGKFNPAFHEYWTVFHRRDAFRSVSFIEKTVLLPFVLHYKSSPNLPDPYLNQLTSEIDRVRSEIDVWSRQGGEKKIDLQFFAAVRASMKQLLKLSSERIGILQVR